MTPRKLWVLKAHTKPDKIHDFFQNICQDFDIYRNIDHQKAKKLKRNKGKHIRHTNKHATKQINKRTNTETKKQKNKQAMSHAFFLVRCNGWSHCVRPNETNEKTTSKQSREPTQTHELYM